MIFLFYYQHAIVWLLWCFYQLFEILFWQHPFTAEDPLVSRWGNAKFLQMGSKRNKLIYSTSGWPDGKYIFIME